MSRATEVLGKILSAFVRSLFVSGVMFVIFFSIVTGGFPPDFGKLNRAINSLQGMSQLAKEPSLALPASSEVTAGFEEDKDLMQLEAYNKKRAELGEGLFGDDAPKGSLPTLRSLSSVANDDLKDQMREMQQEIFRLQQRVSELEEKLKDKSVD